MPPVSDFFERKRRLAYVIAGVSLALLVLSLNLNIVLENYARANAVADVDTLYVVHRTVSYGAESPDSRLLAFDPTTLKILQRFPLLGEATALLVHGDEVTIFFGNRYAVFRGGAPARNADLPQKWDVLDAVHDAANGQDWIFGWADGKIVARKRRMGILSEDISLLESGPLDRLSASMDGAAGPLLAWRERGSQVVKTARFDGHAFVPYAEFDVGSADYWDVVLTRGRALLVYYRREDGTFKYVGLRVRCCTPCGLPAPPDLIRIADKVVIGRAVTGISGTVIGDSLVLILTRPTTLQGAALPLATLTPEPGARLVPLGGEPLWRRLAGMSLPMVTLFFSFSLIFLGFTLIRERGRFVLEMFRPVASTGPVPAAVLQRAMAHTLDQTLLLPLVWITSEVLNAVPESAVFEPFEAKTLSLFAIWSGLHVVYHAVLEAALGWTVGKKIIGLRVAELDGSRVSLRGALLRNLLRPLDAEQLGVFLGAVVMMLTRRRQRVGDLVARTIVIEESRVPDGPPGARPEADPDSETRSRRDPLRKK